VQKARPKAYRHWDAERAAHQAGDLLQRGGVGLVALDIGLDRGIVTWLGQAHEACQVARDGARVQGRPVQRQRVAAQDGGFLRQAARLLVAFEGLAGPLLGGLYVGLVKRVQGQATAGDRGGELPAKVLRGDVVPLPQPEHHHRLIIVDQALDQGVLGSVVIAVQPQADPEAVRSERFAGFQALANHRHDPLASLARAFGDQLLDPRPEGRHCRRGEDREFVLPRGGGAAQCAEGGSQRDGRVLPFLERGAALLRHGARRRQNALQIEAQQRCRHQTEKRQRGEPPADIGRVQVQGAEALALRKRGERGPRIRDGQKVRWPLGAEGVCATLTEVAVLVQRLGRGPGLARDDEQRAGEVKRPVNAGNMGGVGSVQHGEFHAVRMRPERLAIDLGAEAAPTHAHQHGAPIALFPERRGQCPEAGHLCGHGHRQIEPSQPLLDLGDLGRRM